MPGPVSAPPRRTRKKPLDPGRAVSPWPPTGAQARTMLLAAVTAAGTLDEATQRELAQCSQRGAIAALLLEIDAVDEAEQAAARQHVSAGNRARARLLEAALPVAYATLEAGPERPSPHVAEAALAALVEAVTLFDPGGEHPFLPWVARHVQDRLRVAEPRARPSALTGDGGEAAWQVVFVAARAALVGSPLTPLDRALLAARFGLGDGPLRSLEQAGAALGISREQVRQAELRLLARLRRHPSAVTR